MLLAGWSLIFLSGKHTADRLAQLLHDGLMFDRLLLADPGSMLRKSSTLLSLMFTALLPLLLQLLRMLLLRAFLVRVRLKQLQLHQGQQGEE